MCDDIIHTRREFLGKGLALVSASSLVPSFLDHTAWAMADPLDVKRTKLKPGRPDERILVVVQLAGGNDGLNTVIPYRNDRYYQLRPRLAVARNELHKLTDQFGLHPSATGLKQLYDDGLLAIIQGVGYPNPNRSHFVATDIWSTADPQERAHTGWLGRYLDASCKGDDRPNPKMGIATVQEAPLALKGDKFQPISFGSPDQLSWKTPAGDDLSHDAFERLNEISSESNSEPSQGAAGALTYLQRIAMDARASAREIQDAAGGISTANRRRRAGGGGRRGGSQLSSQLEMVRRMIAAGLDTKVYYASQGGFDTHAGQAGRHQQLMTQLGEGLSTFVKGLETDGTLDKVLVLTFSEFGRRVAENASGGTDHGAAAPMFLMGSRIDPGFHGVHPSLEPAQLDNGDLKWHMDFRSVYAGVLTDWLGADVNAILGRGIKSLPIIKST